MKFYHILFPALIISFTACTSNNTNKSVTDSVAVDTSGTVEIENDTTEAVFNHYDELKNALVESDAVSAAAVGKSLATALSMIKGCEEAARLAEFIGESTDIKQQRASFVTLNNDLMGVIKNADVSSGSIFLMYCPMANEGKGAYWFSSNKSIRNPYYGDEMLTCGEVKEEITKK